MLPLFSKRDLFYLGFRKDGFAQGLGEFNFLYRKVEQKKRHHLETQKESTTTSPLAQRKKPARLDERERDANPKPLDRDRDTRMPGLEEQ